MNRPMTRDEAERYVYGTAVPGWIKYSYRANRCAFELIGGRQCGGLPRHGPGKLYCKSHARFIEQAAAIRAQAKEQA